MNRVRMLLSAVVVAAAVSGAWAESWPCGADGSDLTCTKEGKTLTVSGSGAMRDYLCASAICGPWGQLDSIIIEEGVTSIGIAAFSGRSSLKSVTIHATNPPAVDNGAFNMTPMDSAVLRVPAGSINTYKAANVWKDFGYINPSTVTFKDHIGAVLSTPLVSYGDTVPKPADPAQPIGPAITLFDGWYTEQTARIKWDFSTPVTSDMTLYARWGTTTSVAPRTSQNLSGLAVRQSGRLLRITLPSQWSASACVVSLYNVAGKRLNVSPAHHPDGQITVSLPGLAAGSYLLRVVNGRERQERRVVVR